MSQARRPSALARRESTISSLVVAALLGAGCPSSPQDDIHLPSLRDIPAAPAPIQTAAKAVVRVSTARETATGSFISSTGLLLTNNHVLGDAVCPLEGCYVQIKQMYQRGGPHLQAQIVYAVPRAVDVGLDAAVVQLFGSKGGPALSTPDYLTMRSVDSESMLGMHVTVVGHPEGRLKKWSDGVVVDLQGNWFKSSAYILPGDSGSPTLDDDGQIVGIVHRGPSSQDLITGEGVNVYSVGTPSSLLGFAWSATPQLPNAMIPTSALSTEADAVANNLVYLNAHVANVNIGNSQAAVLTLLANACDAGLVRGDWSSPDDLAAALDPCYDAMAWIECRVDASPVPYGAICPTQTDGTAWAGRYRTMNERWLGMIGQLDLDAITFGNAHLSTTMAAGRAAGAAALQQALVEASPSLDFELASYLAAFAVPSYAGTSIVDYISSYDRVSHYEYQGTSVASAAAWLYSNGLMPKSGALDVLYKLHADPRVSLGTKLYIEDVQYALGVL
jgi:hypothetical protein